MTDCEVRGAIEGDLAAVLRLYVQLSEDQVDARPLDKNQAKALFESIVSQSDRSMLVALVDGKVLGTADLVVVENLTHNGRPWAIVENVVVDREQRNQGVGKALMADLVERARQRGCYKIQLLSLKHRHDAHRFYESVGFQPLAEGLRLYLD